MSPDVILILSLLSLGLHRELREHTIYRELLALSPDLEKRLCTGTDEDVFHIADLVSSYCHITVTSQRLSEKTDTERVVKRPR